MSEIFKNINETMLDIQAQAMNYFEGQIAKDYIERKNKLKVINFNSVSTDKEDILKYKNIRITKRKDNRYQARYKSNAVYKYIYDKTQKGCYNKLKEIFKTEKPIVKKYDLNSWIEKWIEVYKKNKIKENTLHHIELDLNKYIRNSIGKKEITKIQTIKIEELLNKITKERQRQKIYTYLKDIFTKAYKNKIIKENIMQNIDKPVHIKKQSCAFTRKEQKMFLQECDHHEYGDFLKILLYQGLRCGELLALEGRDINLLENYISITKTLNDMGKITSPKTKTSIRKVPIFENIKPTLSKYADMQGRICNKTYTVLYDTFKKIMKVIDLKGFSIHSLRHTFVTRWTENGAPSKLIQKWVGHSSNNITEQVYTKINTDYEMAFIIKNNSNFDTDFDTDF